jgi:hypothetical protein
MPCTISLRPWTISLTSSSSPSPPIREKDGRHLYFPIYPSQSAYLDNAPQRTQGIDLKAKAVIKTLQPFDRGAGSGEPEKHPLMFLHRLELWDKHRTLNTTVARGTFRLRGLPNNVPTETFEFEPEEGHAVYARFPVTPYIREWKVYLEVSRRLVFHANGPAPGEDVLQTLINARRYIGERVLPGLKPFLR